MTHLPFSGYVPDRLPQAIRPLRICTPCSEFDPLQRSGCVPDSTLSLNAEPTVNDFLAVFPIQKIPLWSKSLTPKALFPLRKLVSPQMYLSCGLFSADVPVCGWHSGYVAGSSIGVPHALRMCTCPSPWMYLTSSGTVPNMFNKPMILLVFFRAKSFKKL